ncbi:MAG: peptide chain release factor 1 [Elusimicrobiaceae bacterium]|nr:peptide chain release factor 1 [Elusimicrobiaceae bacterium]
MFKRLEATEKRFVEINEKLCDVEVISDQETYKSLMKELKNLTPVVEKYRELKKEENNLKEAKEMLEEGGMDKEFKEMAEAEIESSKEKIEKLSEELKILLLPKDPNDDRNVIIEIRGGAGGEEAALFSGVLFRMYNMYAQNRRWKVEILNANETQLGGYKEISFMISGEGAYSRFKFESGVHRVQRVPDTEAQGRVHTSTVTVAVLPEAEDVEIEINPSDLQIDTYRAGGAVGQHVNKTESAIRITHLPTGLVVECQDERSQYKNKDKAMKVLKSRLLEAKREEQESAVAEERRSQVGTGDRSERIRTYNYPQSRVTDHRIGLTLYRLEDILNGDLDEIIDALITADRASKLAGNE